MNNSNSKVKVFYDKRLSFTATGILLIWIIITIFGIFSLINIALFFNPSFIFPISFGNPFLYIVFIIGFFPSRSITISLIDLSKNKRWIEPSKFIKGILIQIVTTSIASILTIIFFRANNFTEFFSLFFSYTFIFSIVFLVCCLYYYRYDLPEQQKFRNLTVLGRN